ncbi:FAD dependent oxidoreductase [Paragonimus heterotremus]|uniref:FAD dependent oxidoreductase n=1 Tax=Paragonimus heterotremus TaxID=100268 RepID=A0A8J4T441_9TREM|nr:FAD dependent oxidoreductase [Paragonimus heterotremus]
MVKFGVLGAGIVGLSTAEALQDAYRDAEILILSPEKMTELPSYGAAGGFRPDPHWMPGITCCLEKGTCMKCPFRRWCERSKSHFWGLAASQLSELAGVFFQPMIDVSSTDPSLPPFAATLCGSSKAMENDELESLGFPNTIKMGYSYITCMIEGRYHMPYLLKKLQDGCASVTGERRMQSLNEVYKWALGNNIDVVINSTGLGSSIICEDREVIPVRGQLVRVTAPWMKFGIYGPNSTYVFVGRDSVILGGIRDPLPCILDRPLPPKMSEVSQDVSKDILQRVKNLWRGPLSTAPVVEQWTGFRPQRSIVRLELNWLGYDGAFRKIPIIHNYGHGSMGITLSRGTALDAVYLVEHGLKAGVSTEAQKLRAPGMDKLLSE